MPCNAVYIVEKIGIDKEFYLSLTLNRKAATATFIYSKEGGMNIEDGAHSKPEAVHKLAIDPLKGLQESDLKDVAKNLGIKDKEEQVKDLFKKIYDCFWKNDCDMIEINPLVVTDKGVVMAADSKVTIDDNALFR